MIGRASRGAEILHFFQAEFLEALGIQQSLGFLEKKRLVRGAAAFADKEEFVFAALGGIEVDLRGQVGLGVDLIEHVQRGGLRVAKIFLGVGLIYALREFFGIIAAGPDLLAFFAHDGGGAGVLAERQNAVGGDLGIAQHHQRDHAVIFRGRRVIKDRGNLRKVRGPKREIDRAECLICQQGQGLGLDAQNGLSMKFGDRDMIGAQQFILCGIGTSGVDVLVEKRRIGHAESIAGQGANAKEKRKKMLEIN